MISLFGVIDKWSFREGYILTPYYYRDSSSCLVENQFECDYNIVEKSARLRRMYILNRPNHLEPIK